jgi:DDE superfamily endonuclease
MPKRKKNLIEAAYLRGEQMGLVVCNEDEAGPFQSIPQPGPSWQPLEHCARQPHEYIRAGTAKLLTLFHPASGQVRVQGVPRSDNAVLHPWLKRELTALLDGLPPPASSTEASSTEASSTEASSEQRHQQWCRWQAGLTEKFTLAQELPPLRMLLILDNLTGHKSASFVCWLMAQGIMPLYTPLGGSWLNMAESIQRILVRRALLGQHPRGPSEIMDWLETTARAWNREPTPFVWGGARQTRRERAYRRRHALGGSSACTLRFTTRKEPAKRQRLRPCQMTH